MFGHRFDSGHLHQEECGERERERRTLFLLAYGSWLIVHSRELMLMSNFFGYFAYSPRSLRYFFTSHTVGNGNIKDRYSFFLFFFLFLFLF